MIAEAIAKGVARWRRDVVLIGLAGSQMLEVFREAGFAVAAEAFADRRYEPDGTLRSRKFDDALIRDPEEAGRQALNIVQRGSSDCVRRQRSPDQRANSLHSRRHSRRSRNCRSRVPARYAGPVLVSALSGVQ